VERPTSVAGVTLSFVGAGDAFGSGGRLQTCIHVGDGTEELLLDCGATSLVGLKRLGFDPEQIGHIVVSHLHGDHFGGIPFFVLDGQFSRRKRPLVIAGPRGIRARVLAAMEVLFPGSSTADRRFTIDFVELDERVATAVGPATVTAYEVEHACGAPPFALSVDFAGRRVAYSGDTEWTEVLVEVARGADLFICEAYFFEKKIRYHLDYATLRANVSRLDAKRVVITHMNRDLLNHLPEVDLECAEDGLALMV
jgi:ribonuclease BN (tRNA processing enzyme)